MAREFLDRNVDHADGGHASSATTSVRSFPIQTSLRADWGAPNGRDGNGFDPSPLPVTPAPIGIHRAPASPEGTTEESTEERKPAEGVGPLIVDDGEAPGSGQMSKGEFIATLKSTVTARLEELFKGTKWSTENCPWLVYWFGYYEGKSAAHIESAIGKFAPETAGSSTAQQYIDRVTDHVRSSVMIWMATGRVTGVPEHPDAGGAPSRGGASGAGRIMPMARMGGFNDSRAPETVRQQLGGGSVLDGSIAARMSTALGHDFSDVRVHTDPTAHELSDAMNARAFAVGNHVAFGRGEYRPGTMTGDGLLAHELTHVAQQRGATSTGGAESGRLEREAEGATTRAMARLWGGGGAKGATKPAPLSRGMHLSLQRCQEDAPEMVELKSDADYVMDAVDKGDFATAFTLMSGREMWQIENVCEQLAYYGRLDKLMLNADKVKPEQVSDEQMKRIKVAMAVHRLTYSYSNNKLSRYPDVVKEELDRLRPQIEELSSEDQKALGDHLKYSSVNSLMQPQQTPTQDPAKQNGNGTTTQQAGVQPPQLKIGTEIHKAIAQYYISRNRADVVLTNYYPMTSLLARLVPGYVKPKRSQRPPELRLKPDITNITQRVLYEIKPVSLVALAKSEADMYLALFHREGATDMTLGPSDNPGVSGTTTIDNVVYTFFSPMPGVIVYKAPDEEGEKERVREPVRVPVRQPSTDPVIVPPLTPAPGTPLPEIPTIPEIPPVFEPIPILVP